MTPDQAPLCKRAGVAIKVLLHNEGQDQETPWAEDLGPSPVAPGARRVRLVNIPFLNAKPTYGDVIVAIPNADGVLAWDRGGVAWEHIDQRIEEDGGRWVMIIGYRVMMGELLMDS